MTNVACGKCGIGLLRFATVKVVHLCTKCSEEAPKKQAIPALDALSDLPDQGEPAEDKPPVSDKELGRICLGGCDFKCRCCTPDQCVGCVPEGVQFFAGVAAIRAKLAGQ